MDDLEPTPTWNVQVEPEIEIQESEQYYSVLVDLSKNTLAVRNEDSPCVSDSDEESSFKAVQEYETVLVDKICEVCGNPFQAFELVNPGKRKSPYLTTCESCSYYITPHMIDVDSIPESNHSFRTDNIFSCEYCKKSFDSVDRLNRHKVTHMELKPFSCKLCCKSFKRNDRLVEHIKNGHSEVAVDLAQLDSICDICGGSDKVLNISVGDNVVARINLCQACNVARLERLKDTNKSKFQCDLCARFFSRSDHTTRHRLTHFDVRPHECYVCGKSFNRNDKLLKHMGAHPGAKPFSCRVCFQRFTNRNELNDHLTTHPSRILKLQKCPICQKAFRDKEKLNRHLSTHADTRPFICEVCGKTFKIQEALSSHLQTHNKHKPFSCNTCGMAFKLKETFKRHLLVHSTAKTYSCPICSKTFKRSDKLKAHNLVHLNIRPFSCELCDKTFKRKDKYVRHKINVHKVSNRTNCIKRETDITCEACGKTFDCEDDLTEHAMIHYR